MISSYYSVRGSLASLYDLSLNFGLIISFLLGNYLSTLDQAKLYLIMPIVSIIVLFLFPESPEYLKKNGLEDVCTNDFINWNYVSFASILQF